MKLTRTVATILIAAFTLGACGSDAPLEGAATTPATPTTTTAAPGAVSTRLWIRPDLVDCIGEAPQQCMQIANSEDGEYLYFYDSIQGFTFAEGTSYVIDVSVEEIPDPPADASSLRYTLIEIIEENPGLE